MPEARPKTTTSRLYRYNGCYPLTFLLWKAGYRVPDEILRREGFSPSDFVRPISANGRNADQ